MMKQYNKNIRFYDHVAGDMVWLKTKYFKTGENRKLSARRNGPWAIVRKMPNGVNFEIKNEKTSDIKIVHHDRLSPVKKSKNVVISNNEHAKTTLNDLHIDSDLSSTGSSSASHSDYSIGTDSDSESEIQDNIQRYPDRQRTQREIPGAIPWASLNM